MKPRRFRFRLARVLRVREIEEQSLRAAWGAAEQAALHAEQRLAAARADLVEARAELARRQASGRMAAGEVLAVDQLLELRRKAFPVLAQRAAAARDEAEARRADWVGSRRERRSLELYRERALVKHREEQTRAEAAAMDEVAATQTERRRRHASRIPTHPEGPNVR